MTLAPFSLRSSALKPADIASRLDVEVSTVYRWIRSGELPFVELAGAKYVLVPAFERFLERRNDGVTLEQQAERYIGAGAEEEHENAFDPLEGLSLPIAIADTASPRDTPGGGIAPGIQDARTRLREQLDEFESEYRVASERIHRLHFVEHESSVEGIPDEVVAQWAGAYAAYLNLSLVVAR